jgi:hypothetical protein
MESAPFKTFFSPSENFDLSVCVAAAIHPDVSVKRTFTFRKGNGHDLPPGLHRKICQEDRVEKADPAQLAAADADLHQGESAQMSACFGAGQHISGLRRYAE